MAGHDHPDTFAFISEVVNPFLNVLLEVTPCLQKSVMDITLFSANFRSEALS